MASNSDIEEGPVNPRNSQKDSEIKFFDEHWGNPELEFGVLEVDDEKKKAEDCKKKSDHDNFIKVSDFSKYHLENYTGIEVDDVFEYIKSWIPFTVKMHIKEISAKRQRHEKVNAPYNATGVIDAMKSIHVNEPCPCSECNSSDSNIRRNEYWSFIVYTAFHVIYDDTEAASSELECFHESDDDKEVKKLYGIKIIRTICERFTLRTDRCQVLCVTHDQELANRLNALTLNSSLLNPLYNTDLGVIISHPHGWSKRITIGKIKHLKVPISDFPQEQKIKFGEGAQYHLPESWDRGQHKHQEGFELQPGTNELSSQMAYQLPHSNETEYALRFMFLDMPWLTFPPKTTFFLPDGNEFEFPPETKFSIDMISQPYVYASYDIHSCPGSSGALILMDWGEPPVEGFRHFGTTDVGDELNKSGRQLYVQ